MSTTPVIALSKSPSFSKHLTRILAENHPRLLESWRDYASLNIDTPHILLIHAGLLEQLDKQEVHRVTGLPHVQVGIASDIPALSEALSWLPVGIQAYFNSHMADTHYQHMLNVLSIGQNWVAPQVLQGLVTLAQNGMTSPSAFDKKASFGLDMLTPRELEIAEAVSSGMKNKVIAERFGVTERTVKAHLSNIFQKLGVQDRLELAVRLHGKETA